MESQLKILKNYDTFAKEKANEVSSSVLQELVEKEKAADDIIYNLNSRFHIPTNKILPLEESQSAPGRAQVSLRGLLGLRP